MDRKIFDTPVLPRLETILAEVAAGDLVVPEFQRPFVWEDELRLQLLDSIASGMPIGSLLVWRTSQRQLKIYREVGGVSVKQPPQSTDKIGYLIDGHQRVSTLFGALFPGPRDEEDGEHRWPLFYELGTKDRPAFRTPPRRGTIPEHWLPLSLIFDGDRLFDFTQRLRQRGQRDLAKDAERLANLFRDYIIPIVPLVTEELNVVTNAFVRINSLGRSMTEAHMLRALTYLSAVDTDSAFEGARARLAPLGWEMIDAQILVNVLKAQLGLEVYSAEVRGLHERLKRDAAPLEQLTDLMVEVVEFLTQVGVFGLGALPYANQLVTLAAVFARVPTQARSAEGQDLLRRWFWTTTYTEQFKGIAGNQIRKGIEQLQTALEGGANVAPNSLSVRPIGKKMNGNAVRLHAFLLFLARRPKDAEAQLRRELWLALGRGRISLFANQDNLRPGNYVLANSIDLARLREALESNLFHRTLPPNLADEFALPEEALALLPDVSAFIDARERILLTEERAFIESLGLQVSEDE